MVRVRRGDSHGGLVSELGLALDTRLSGDVAPNLGAQCAAHLMEELIMRKPILFLFAVALGLSAAVSARAAEMYPWRQHQDPFSFVFRNDIDSHQQTRQERDGSLNGYLYIRYTGVVTKDNFPVATHADCNAAGADCSVGWTIKGKPSSAKLVRQPMHDHPVFLLARSDIPQPGSYAHFHWTGVSVPMPYQSADGFLLELTSVNSFCFVHHGSEGAISAKSCRENEGIKVERGVDVATHLNIVTNDPAGQ